MLGSTSPPRYKACLPNYLQPLALGIIGSLQLLWRSSASREQARGRLGSAHPKTITLSHNEP